MIESFLEIIVVLITQGHVKTSKKTYIFLMILKFYLIFKKKLRINTINKPKPINAKEKVAKNDNPTISVFKLADILCTISELLEGLWVAK